MLVGYTGTPRSGKTYSVIKDWYLETLIANVDNPDPRHIYTNINGLLSESCLFATAEYTGLSIGEIQEQVHIVGDAWFLTIWLNVPDHSLVLADEAHKYWCSREWKSFPPEGRDYIAESGQHDVDIVWISQTSGSVEKWIVSRSEFINSAINLAWIGMSNRFALRQRDGLSQYSNMKPTYHKIEKRVYDCYKSYQVEHKTINRKTSSLFGNTFKLSFLGLFLFFFYMLFGIFSDDEPPKVEASINNAVNQNAEPDNSDYDLRMKQVEQNATKEEIKEETTLWIVGIFYRSGKQSFVMLEDEKRQQFKASKVGLRFRISRSGEILSDDNILYEAGNSITVPTAKLKNLKFKPQRRESAPNRVLSTYTMPQDRSYDSRLPKSNNSHTRLDYATGKFVPVY